MFWLIAFRSKGKAIKILQHNSWHNSLPRAVTGQSQIALNFAPPPLSLITGKYT